MRKLMLAAFVAVASAQLAPAANAACAETHGSQAHVHSAECSKALLGDCPIPDVQFIGGIGFECD